LRTPITAINGFSELLKREIIRETVEPDRSQRFVNRLTEAGSRLSALVDDMLDVSRIRLGQLPLRLKLVDLGSITHRVVAARREQFGSEHHQFVLQIPDRDCSLVVDEDRLEQVVSNLLDNAVKYSPNGGNIRVQLEAQEDALTLTIADPGIGLPAEALDSIFQPFGRAPNAIQSNLPGLGLGLFICRNIVERHGGQIWAESEGDSKGTTMSVRLPKIASENALAE
jgi:signal transduction histidine kinase